MRDCLDEGKKYEKAINYAKKTGINLNEVLFLHAMLTKLFILGYRGVRLGKKEEKKHVIRYSGDSFKRRNSVFSLFFCFHMDSFFLLFLYSKT